MTKVIVPASVEDTRKATKLVVAQVKELTEVRAEIIRLEARKDALIEALEAQFEVDKVAKTSKFTTLIHNAIEVARVEWRSRKGTDEALLKAAYPEAYEATRKVTRYSTIVSLYK
jgi:hypothetical protein